MALGRDVVVIVGSGFAVMFNEALFDESATDVAMTVAFCALVIMLPGAL
ncbi:MAG TPA: hypothetical protein VEJ67_02595 [Candidatus Cybelea sp.]|nr:hypothetical protein [Candidatus Cybelea sp.]